MMTVQELSEQLVRLPLDERLELLEVLTHSIRETLREEEAEAEVVDIHAEFRQAWREAMEGKDEIPLS
ncbi:MAG TPA: hypothetical protein VHD90_17620, partial [Phototrophicaceae bacterium]|nr:hypothetical protein [Phototrophicaceae bacterium]